MNLDLLIAAGYDTPEKLADFCMMDNDEQNEAYAAAAITENTKKVTWVCDLEKKNHPA